MRKSLILLCVSIILLAFAVGYFVLIQRQSQLDRQALEALQMVAEANGALENESYAVGTNPDGTLRFGFDEAIPRYQKLRELYPDETLPYRNLAVARILKLSAAKSQDGNSSGADNAALEKQARQEAIEALEQLLTKDDSAAAHWLQGTFLDKAGVSKQMQPRIADEFQKATELDPDEPTFWFSLLSSLESYQLDRPEARKQAIEKLKQLAPGNLFATLESLKLAAQTDLASFRKEWEASRPTIQRLNQTIQQYQGTDSLWGNLDKTIEQIDQAVSQQNQSALVGLMFGLSNEVKAKDPYKTDVNRLSANPLDFLLDSFSTELQGKAENAVILYEADWAEIKFSELELSVGQDRQLTDFSLVDVDFDGVLDLVAVGDNQLTILKGPLEHTTPEVLLQESVADGTTGVLACFLLRINDTGSGIVRRIQEANSDSSFEVTHDELPHLVTWGPQGIEIRELQWDAESGYSTKLTEQPEEVTSLKNIREIVPLDYDQDADLDLAVATEDGFHLLMNRSNNTFVEGTQWSSEEVTKLQIQQMQIVDWDRDLDIDLMVLTVDGQVLLLENRLFGKFEVTDLGVAGGVSGFAVADFDGNASWDLMIDDKILFTETRSWGVVQFLDDALEIPGAGIAAEWRVGDFNNDMVLDLYGQPHGSRGKYQGLWSNKGTARYQLEATKDREENGQPNVGDRGDFNRDGLLDVVQIRDGKLLVSLNQTESNNHWLEVLPRGRGDNVSKVNHLAIGSLMEIRVGDRYFAETVTRPTVHVGLGASEEADVARIVWPNGIPQALILAKGDQRVDMLYILKGSCPFIYVWGQGGWEFLSDCLWAAPIGLQSSAGGLVPTRNWEYLRIPPDRLNETAGECRVMLTEELWETAYFDHVRLQAIDHPLGTQVHINDKVGPPSIVQHRLFLVGETRLPLSARDSQGNDVLPVISAEDQVYFRGFEDRITQGFVNSHWIEMDLGDGLSDESTLFLTGWIQPTDTSLNVLLRQHPESVGPEFPAMEVIGENGEWTLASRPIGFPGGKTKTMTIPLSGLFPTADHRVRIRTSNEIYWDHVFIAETPEAAGKSLKVIECQLQNANLRYRGTSRRDARVENGPEEFNASDRTFVSAWPPVAGPFTRYGDAKSIVSAADDDMVVMGTGDALELTFQAPPTLSEGWQRTYLFYSVGYDKDADLNTLEGQDSRPLPFAQMQQYPEMDQPAAVEHHWENSEADRWQSWYRFWRQIRNPYLVHERQETKVPLGSAK